MLVIGSGCKDQSLQKAAEAAPTEKGIPLVFDTDANNELDDQHALTYLLMNKDTFRVLGITVNSTRYGGGIEGHYRDGDRFNNFGDYSVNLFEHIEYGDESRKRSLFDMAAASIVKNPSWASSREIPAPLLVNNRWVDWPDNNRTITIWENFHRDRIIDDFFRTLEKHTPAGH